MRPDGVLRASRRFKLALKSGAVCAAFFVAMGPVVTVAAGGSASADSVAPLMLRLTSDQYRAVIADTFGETITLGGRFEPDPRVDGLLGIGASKVSVSTDGLEQYDLMARTIADQVVAPERRAINIPCKPASEAAADDACARQFLQTAGQFLYRRPLTEQELRARVSTAGEVANKLGSFYEGLSWSLAQMLVSPQFLFRTVEYEPDPRKRGQYRMTGYSKASQLSFFLWNAGPDEQLLAAAQNGDLHTPRGLAREVDRMMTSPRLEHGVRAFFSDMLMFDELPALSKDPIIYPKFSAKVAVDSMEQALRTIVDLTVTNDGDYRDIFTTKKTFLTQNLASVYRIPLVNDVPNGSPDTWQAYEFAADDPRGGLLSQISFLALHSHAGRSSPTLRGKALREVFLCQPVPAPPAAVDFKIVQDTSNPVYKTARDRLNAHAQNPVCAGCHKLTDPMGLALEHFDGGGAYRTTENGVVIDTSGELDRAKFENAQGLGQSLHDHPAATACVVNRMLSYGLGRVPSRNESEWIEALKKDFAAQGYRIPALIRRIATSPEFYRYAPAVTETPVRSTKVVLPNSLTEEVER
ncbi:MAG: DUF1592 domain-containing protein [Rhodospirillaceae bacterium]